MRFLKNLLFFPLCALCTLNALPRGQVASDLLYWGPEVSSSSTYTTPNPISTENKPTFSPRFYLRGDLLYWVPEASGLNSDFGTGAVLRTSSSGIDTTYTKETDVDPSFDWSVGYRIAMGWQLDNERWEVGGLWTDFHGSGHVKVDHGKWKVILHQLDLAALYNLCYSVVHLQPFIGLRGASIFQKLHSQVITEVTFSGLGTAIDTRTFSDHQQFYGLGPLFGLNSNYGLNSGLGLYANIAFGLLYGSYHLHFKDSEMITPPATPSQIFSKLKKDMKAFDFCLDLALGVQWEYLIRNRYCLNGKLGLENHHYFDQSRLGHNLGNLSFSGGVFSLGLAL